MRLRELAPALALLVACGGSPQRGKDACQADSDCGPGLYCHVDDCPADGAPCDPNECRQPLALGAVCSTARDGHQRCQAGMSCNYALNETCAVLQSVGGACGYDLDCAEAMPGGIFCDWYLKECKLPGSVAEGGACGLEKDCGPDLTCGRLPDSPTGTGACFSALPEASDCSRAGEACIDADRCDESGRCVPKTG